MKRLLSLILILHSSLFAIHSQAQGWPSQYSGVMLQSFYWDSFTETQWATLESQADELSRYFSLIWVPQSGNCDGVSMGYNPKYYWDQNSTFGTEAELRSMISTFKAKGLGTIADVVINHRQNLSGWFDFPKETYKGETYEMLSTDIVSDDDGGQTAAEAKKQGVQLSANKDSGEGWNGMRDIDHASANVQRIIKAYEDYLLNDLGYIGFRYDVGKGFAAKYFGMYNVACKPQYSVGEVWDSNSVIKNWIEGTKTDGAIQSAAFDFQFKYQVRDAVDQNNWAKIAGSNCLIYGDGYKRYAVTFLENHDTEVRFDGTSNGPLRKDTIAANAYMLVMPGTPCVFIKHWMAYKKEIKKMIEVRRMAGIHSESNYLSVSPGTRCTAIKVSGKNTDVIVAVGQNASTYSYNGFKELTSGYHYKYLVPESFDTSAWPDIVKRIEEETVEPQKPALPEFATVQEGTYAYFEKPASWGNTINVWAWYTGGTNVYGTINWPGTAKDVTLAGTNSANNNKVYLWKYSGNGNAPAMIIFNDGARQTGDFEFVNGGYYTQAGFVDVVTSTGIDNITIDPATVCRGVYSLSGQRLGTSTDGLKPGLYVKDGKKIVVK